MSGQNQFSNRWGIILAALGMAIGAGNLWRFPRLAGQYGGAFIVLWIFFLLVWSIPLLMAEFAIGKRFRKGVIGSMAMLAGKKYSWMGFFVTVCTLGIAFYYSVVTAWSVEYLAIASIDLYKHLFEGWSLSDAIIDDPDYLSHQWSLLANDSWLTMLLYVLVVFAGVYVVSRGVKNGLEKANKILIPGLFVLLIIVGATALSMENGVRGLNYMFEIKWSAFSDSKIWIEALSQSAWSTGAGWGLMITLSGYSREKEDVTLNTFIGAFGNNAASLLSGMAILPAVFALAETEQMAISHLQSGSQALTFTIIPSLFAKVPGGYFMAVFFFLALSIAAFSSFLPMLELMRSNLLAVFPKRSVRLIVLGVAFVIFGLPSAKSLDFFSNQDWVWGIGLVVSGIFIAFATVKSRANEFKRQFIDADSDFHVPDFYFKYSLVLSIPLGCVLIYWWMSQQYSADPWFTAAGKWNWLDVYSNATIVTQWGLVVVLGVILNRWLYKRFTSK